MSDLFTLSQKPWKQVASVSDSASVFLDDAAAEIFHWSEGEGAKEGLLQLSLGMYSLYEDLNPIAKDFIAQAPYCHVVIVTTSPLIGHCAERIATLLSDIQPLECHVFCSVSESIHEEYIPMGGVSGDKGGDEEQVYSHYGEFQALMRKWIKRESGVRVSVSHLNLFHTEILPNLFVTPVYHDSLLSLLPSDIPLIQEYINEVDPDTTLGSLQELEFKWLPENYLRTMKSFVHSFNSLLASMDLQEDIFSVGQTSHLMADHLCSSEEAKERRKSAGKRCSVLFIDRSLDLASPCVHSSDYLMDKILSLLPPLHTNSTDVAFSMAPLSQGDPSCLVPGCLSHPGNQRAKSIMSSLTFSKQKEALMDLSRSLLESLSREKISSRPVGRMAKPSSAQVKNFLEQFKNNPTAILRHHELLQMACGVVEVMEQSTSSKWDQLCKDEQKISQNLLIGDNRPSVVKYILNLVDSQLQDSGKVERQIELVDILSLVVEFYSLVGEECYVHHVEERNLKESLLRLIMIRRECDEGFLKRTGFVASWTRLEVTRMLDDMFSCFNTLGVCRDHLTNLKDIYTPDADNSISSIIVQLLESIMDPARPDLPDVRHHSHGLSNIIRSGFSLFMSSARPRPDINPLLVVFIVGGLSIAEMRAVKEMMSLNKPNFEVYLGTNKILTPDTVVEDLITRSKLLSNQ